MSLPPLAPLPFVSNVCFGVLSDAYAARTAYCRRQNNAWFFNVNDHALFYKSDLGPFYERSSRWFLSHERHRFRGIGLAPILLFREGALRLSYQNCMESSSKTYSPSTGSGFKIRWISSILLWYSFSQTLWTFSRLFSSRLVSCLIFSSFS